jgi:hypothetical protein
VSKKLGDMPDDVQDDVVQTLTDSFFQSEELAVQIQDLIVKLQPSPISVVFAAMVIDKGMGQQVKGWPELRKFAIESFQTMEKNGILGELKMIKPEDR